MVFPTIIIIKTYVAPILIKKTFVRNSTFLKVLKKISIFILKSILVNCQFNFFCVIYNLVLLWPRRSIKSRGNKLVCFSFSMIMQALRYHPGESDFVLERNLSHPVIEDDDDVLVKVEFAGLCGTDLHIVGVRFFFISMPCLVIPEFFQTIFRENLEIVPLFL